MAALEISDFMRLIPERFQYDVVVFTVVLCSLCSGISYADEVDDFIEQIQSASNGITAFSSAFIQEKHLALFAEPVLFTGHLFIARPNRLRWEFTSPMASVLVLDGDLGMRCADTAAPVKFDLKNDPVMRGVAEQLWLWLGGDYKKLKNLFNLKKSGEHTLVITPQSGSVTEYIGSVSIQFDAASKQPQQIEILEPGGDLTKIIFTSYERNPAVTAALFKKCSIDE